MTPKILRTLCAALDAAKQSVGEPLFAPRARKSDGSLSKDELISVNALIAYAAYLQNVSEEEIRDVVKCAFGKSDVSQIEDDNYKAVVHYLVDLSTNKEFFKDDFNEGAIYG